MTLIPKEAINIANIMLRTGSRYQNEGFTLIKACDITMEMANTVEIKALITIMVNDNFCLFVHVAPPSYSV